jgi:hypothetical protein
MSKNINPEIFSTYTIARSSCSQVECRCSASVSTRDAVDAVDTTLISPSSLVCIKTAATAFPLASVCIICIWQVIIRLDLVNVMREFFA